MDKELDLLLPLLCDASKISINGFSYHSGFISGNEVVVCKCGIGKVNSAIGALTLIDNFHPAIVINTGAVPAPNQAPPSAVRPVSNVRCRPTYAVG